MHHLLQMQYSFKANMKKCVFRFDMKMPTKFSSKLISKRLSFSKSQDRAHAEVEHDDVHDGHHDEINALSLNVAELQPCLTLVMLQLFDHQI